MNTKVTTYLSTGLIIAGFLLLVLAWNGAASTRYVDAQIPYLVSGGLAGIGLIGCGCTLALVQELRKTAASIAAATEKLVRTASGEDDPLVDTLPQPRTGSTIERDVETADA